ncbi:MAG TPA: preprotein translocase subunit SecY [Candidatus Acetothermia bacterium]|nr:preprotein translocase subunit SecY [Candidatus Acetothermia bacterium]
MFERIRGVFAVAELRQRIIYTLLMLLVFRIGVHIPVPGVDARTFADILSRAWGGIFQFVSMFTGGGLRYFSLFALGVIPYINVSIIMSLLMAVFPKLKELQQQGREGRKKITQYTRWGTVGMAAIMSVGYAMLAVNAGVAKPSPTFFLTAIIAMTTGSIFLMWIGERITENGIGNGISMIIMAGIVARYPYYFSQIYTNVSTGAVSVLWLVIFVVMFVVVIAAATVLQQAQRKIVVQYAKRTAGRRIYGGHTAHLPIRVNQGGVIPIIFALAILQLPYLVFRAVPSTKAIAVYFAPPHPVYLTLYALLIIFFAYFYASIIFDPNDVAKNLREAGGFVPGVRPGQPTALYLQDVSNKILLVGALFLTAIALIPYILGAASGLRASTLLWLGGTSLLIVVGVGIDTLMQIEAHLVMHHYESLIKGTGAAFLGRRR